MINRLLLLLALSLPLLAGCPVDEGGTPIATRPTTQASTASSANASGSLGNGDATSSTTTASPAPTPTPVSLSMSSAALTLYAPPMDGSAPLFTPTTAQLTITITGNPTPAWQSSDPSVVTVDSQGNLAAKRSGTAVISASYQNFLATASVTVQEKARLVVSAANSPAQMATLAVSVYDASGNTLSSSGSTVDTLQLAGLSVVAVAKDSSGNTLGAGRCDGVTLENNELANLSVPLNAPTLSSLNAGAPGAMVTVSGSSFLNWAKKQDGGLTTYRPTLTALLDGVPTNVTPISDTKATVTVPNTLSGTPATRPLSLNVGGVTLSGTFHLLGSLMISPTSTTVSMAEAQASLGGAASQSFSVTAYDTAASPVSGADVTWGVLGGAMGDPVIGSMSGNLFMPQQTGTATVVVHSGMLFATASVTVIP